MPCFKPLKGYRAKKKNPSGKYSIVFNPKYGYLDLPQTLPCGQCIGCRLERSRQWAIRCHHESLQHENNCFITLTYNDENLPYNQSLNKKHFQLFMKRLRKKFGNNIRFFHCGEYGDQFNRPHYHACLFNFDFTDKVLFKVKNGNEIYSSQTLEKIWGKGFCTVTDLTFDTAAYAARYITKKVTGELAPDHYTKIDDYGEITELTPEYNTMSRRPGIGKTYYDKWTSDIYPSDYVIINGKKCKPPKYYDSQHEICEPDELKKIKTNRKNSMILHEPNNTPERLEVREKLQEIKAKQLIRSYEND